MQMVAEAQFANVLTAVLSESCAESEGQLYKETSCILYLKG